MNSNQFALVLIITSCMVNPLLVFDVQRKELITISYIPLAKLLLLVLMAVCFKTRIQGFRIIK